MADGIESVPVSAIRINGDTQSRVELNQATILEYAESLRGDVALPPLTLFFDGASFWLADGFHRFHAHREAGFECAWAEIRTGTQRDAILYSVGANAAHGLRRTNDDKRKAVGTLLADAEWSTWSDREIARQCGVTHPFVANLRRPPQVVTVTTPEPSKVVTVTTLPPPAEIAAIEGKQSASPSTSLATPLKTPDIAPSSVKQSVGPKADHHDGGAGELVPASELQTLRDQVEELADSLASTLADNEMMGRIFDADDKIKAALEEAKRQRTIAENAERTLMAKNSEYIARADAVKLWKNRAERAEKALAKLKAGAA